MDNKDGNPINQRHIQMKKKAIKVILGIFVTIFLLYFLMKQINLGDIAKLFKKMSLFWFAAGFILYLLSYLARASRFKVILNSNLKLKKLFEIVSVHTMMNNILPARTGELSYIYLITKQDIKGVKAASSLVVARLFDFIIIILIFLTSILFLKDVPLIISSSLSVVYIFFAFIVLFLFALIFFGKRIIRYSKKIYPHLWIKKYKVITKILTLIKNIVIDFESIRSKRRIATIFLISVFIWVLQYSTLNIILISVGIHLPLVFVIVSITLMNLSAVLPIQGIGGFGTIEGSWAIGLLMFGISKDVAISTAFFNHIVIIIYFLTIGIYSWFMLNKSKNI